MCIRDRPSPNPRPSLGENTMRLVRKSLSSMRSKQYHVLVLVLVHMLVLVLVLVFALVLV